MLCLLGGGGKGGNKKIRYSLDLMKEGEITKPDVAIKKIHFLWCSIEQIHKQQHSLDLRVIVYIIKLIILTLRKIT